jgi:CheY-like chemotaxis protein
VLADPTRLQQVFWNLLSNAIKFTPEGGRVTIHAQAAADPDRFEVHIRDTGEGIAADFLPHLFDRFRQADGSTSRRHGGLGIGLAIVKQLVEMHGGTIQAHSEGLGRGAAFTVSLPACRSEVPVRAESEIDPYADSALPADALAGVRILVVEDQPHMLDIVRRVLEEVGAQVIAVESGIEALGLLRSNSRPPFDVLVSDIGMPHLDGYALIRAVRHELGLSAAVLPAVAVTAFARPEDKTRLLAAGFQAHLCKPYQVAQLVSTVRELGVPTQRLSRAV